MKKYILQLTLFLITITSCSQMTNQPIEDGDIIFQTSKSSQSSLITIATKSKLTHVGMIVKKNGKNYVFEAVNPVKITPLDVWINRGVNKKYVIMRYKQGLTKEQKKIMSKYGSKQLGKKYDSKFKWGDDSMYCSELVYKTYSKIGLILCPLKTFKDYNINNQKIKTLIKQRYGSSFNINEIVVSPSDLYGSSKLKIIKNTY